MLSVKLPASEVWRAIEVYLALAYEGSVPSAVRRKLDTLRSMAPEEFFESPVFERDPAGAPSQKMCLRLGNRVYPHMKLTIERSPDKSGYLFRADTHDKHICPAAGTREYQSFQKLMETNQQLAQAIETAWATQGLQTFKTYLRDDLARRAKGS